MHWYQCGKEKIADMENVKIVNTQTKQESEDAFRKIMSERASHNKKATLFLVFLIVAWIAAMVAIYVWVDRDDNALVGLFTSLIACVLVYCCIASYESTCEMSWPAAYRYNKILEEYRVLDVSVHCENGYNYVKLDVADKNDEVSHKYLYGFQRVVKANIDAITIDMINEKIYEPYA
jgi:hypothetical protein